MNTQTNSTSPLHGLTPADRQLLNLAIAHNLNLRSLLAGPSSKDSPAPALALTHPARADLLSFAEWFAQPHISAAADFLVASLTHIDTLSQNLSFKTLRAGLESAFQSVLSFAASLPCTPENAVQGNRIYRESRLIASTIKRFTPSLSKRTRPPSDPAGDASCSDRADLLPSTSPKASLRSSVPHHTLAPAPAALTPPASSQVDSVTPQPQEIDELAHRFIRAHGIYPAPATKLLAAVSAAPPLPKPPLLIQRDPLAMLKK